ncbi:hypothetical protein P154DRAFT_540517 [Amniculicola lignicola CBS 123094]|uniref:Uncharacterized protein n=1 Tax=Amniculicola lignicola CBS 123094 TaxID=1392246 RepID=A0A6A5W2J0_9PLEO|nr:hypothetical protein P154DRAFT_540517 [Amniculicola lignicola CBS 123094]
MDTTASLKPSPGQAPRKGCMRNLTERSAPTNTTMRVDFDISNLSSKDITAIRASEHAADIFTKNSFRIPADDANIRRSTHPSENLTSIFPSDNDNFLVVRQFLYTALTNRDWGIGLYFPELVRATVQNWPQRDLVAKCIRHAIGQILEPVDAAVSLITSAYPASLYRPGQFPPAWEGLRNQHDDVSTTIKLASQTPSRDDHALLLAQDKSTGQPTIDDHVTRQITQNSQSVDQIIASQNSGTGDTTPETALSRAPQKPSILKPRRSLPNCVKRPLSRGCFADASQITVANPPDPDVTETIRFEDTVQGEPPQTVKSAMMKPAKKIVLRSVEAEASLLSRRADEAASNAEGRNHEHAARKRPGIFSFVSGETNASFKKRGIVLPSGDLEVRLVASPTNPRSESSTRPARNHNVQNLQQLLSQSPAPRTSSFMELDYETIRTAHADTDAAQPAPMRKANIRQNSAAVPSFVLSGSNTSSGEDRDDIERTRDLHLAMNTIQRAIQDIEAGMSSLEDNTTGALEKNTTLPSLETNAATPDLEMNDATADTPTPSSPVTPDHTPVSIQFTDQTPKDEVVKFEANNGSRTPVAKAPFSKRLRRKISQGFKALKPTRFR